MTHLSVGTALRIVCFVLIAGTSAPVSGQTPPNQDTLAALLSEVRALRTAMEQMASAGPRIQIAFGRLQLQEGRVQTLVRRHLDVREQLASAEREADLFVAQYEVLQGEARETQDLERRRALERELPHAKAQQEQLVGEAQRLRGLEAELAQQVASEQARWMELYTALEELERALRR